MTPNTMDRLPARVCWHCAGETKYFRPEGWPVLGKTDPYLRTRQSRSTALHDELPALPQRQTGGTCAGHNHWPQPKRPSHKQPTASVHETGRRVSAHRLHNTIDVLAPTHVSKISQCASRHGLTCRSSSFLVAYCATSRICCPDSSSWPLHLASAPCRDMHTPRQQP
jgi:hypothetical protein